MPLPARCDRSCRPAPAVPRSARPRCSVSATAAITASSRPTAGGWNRRSATDRIKTSKATIDDLTWGLSNTGSTTSQDLVAYQEYRRQIAIATVGKGDNRTKTYREIMSFPNDTRIARAAALMDRKHPNYHLRFYDYNHAGTPALLQFYIFDRMEVAISSHSTSGSPQDNRYTVFRNAQLAETISHYFETVWRQATVLKDSSRIPGRWAYSLR